MLMNQEFLMRLLNSSEFVAPPAPPQPPTRGHQYRETIPATKENKPNQTKQHKTKTDDNRNSCASSCSSKCTCCSTCMDHRPSSLPSPSPSPRPRAGGRPGGRSPSPGSASTVLVSAPGGVCAIAPVEEPGLGSRPRVVPRTGPVNPRKGTRPSARPPASSLPKEKGK